MLNQVTNWYSIILTRTGFDNAEPREHWVAVAKNEKIDKVVRIPSIPYSCREPVGLSLLSPPTPDQGSGTASSGSGDQRLRDAGLLRRRCCGSPCCWGPERHGEQAGLVVRRLQGRVSGDVHLAPGDEPTFLLNGEIRRVVGWDWAQHAFVYAGGCSNKVDWPARAERSPEPRSREVNL